MKKKILLINNETHFIDDLVAALRQHSVEIVDFQTVLPSDVEGFDCVILSGGGTAGEVSESEQLYQNEIRIVRESGLPVFGICEGFEVIGTAYNSHFRISQSYRHGLINIRILNDDPIFRGINGLELRVFEYHHISIESLGEELVSLAFSEDGIEVIRHRNKLIYGSQFHPEELQDGNTGHTLLQNFLQMI